MSRATPRSIVGAAALAAALVLSSAPASAEDVKVDSDTFGGLPARSIGPAAMSGRVTDLDAVPGERLTVWVGAAAGGVWKSSDGGITFKPVFDKHTQAVGALAVDPSDSKTVWVGTGESWVRNSTSAGDGVYRTTDAGETWTRLGLEKSERIARIAVHPKDGQVVYVCATGPLYADGGQRGVFRTRDAGQTWEPVLGSGPDAGCADLVLDPADPQTVYAAMWQVRRKPHFFTSGGPRSGLHRSTDGGTTWEKLGKGLPAGDLGRIALAISAARPQTVFATVEAKETGLYRSDDRGATWSRVSTARPVTQRPFYFSRLVADPKSPDRLYKTALFASVSDDGGKTWSTLAGGDFGASYHPDIHAIWVNPANTEQLVIGTDGGVYVSYDRGARWRFVATLPLSQFYHVSVDSAMPYNVYGGLQDNNTWYGPSRQPGGILNKHWTPLTGGDGFWVFPDPTDEDIVYSEYQGGNLFRTRKSTGESKDLRPSPKEGEPKYRFNWNTPIHMSPNAKGTMYYGAQFLFRSRDRGESWERLSPDLTTNDPAKLKQDDSGGLTLDNSTAENHCTIFTISESPKNAEVIWVGTDDGNLQVTSDGGRTWTNTAAAGLPGLPKGTGVSRVEASRFDEAAAFVTFDGHMTGDDTPYVYRTTDLGRTWTSLSSADLKGAAHVVVQDPVSPDLLFVGTESGLFASVDGGKQWGQITSGLPPAPVRDLVIHPREHDLVIGTHGRGVYILDDVTPLRALSPEVLAAEAAFLPNRPATLAIPNFGGEGNGDDEYQGRSFGEVAHVTYWLKKRHMFGDLRIEVYDPQGRLLSSFPGGKRRGINRVEWPMRQKAPRVPAAAGIIPNFFAFLGPRPPAGEYTVKLVKGKDTLTTKLDLVNDPRSTHTDADRALQQETVWKLFAELERLTFVVDGIVHVREQAKARAAGLPAKDGLRKKLEALADAMESQRTALVATKEGEGISGEEKLREELGTLYGNVNGYEGRPTESQLQRMKVLAKDLDAAEAKLDATIAKDVAAVNAELARRKLEAVQALGQDEWQKGAGKS